jgi:microsomal dipeptidase-like Zn-dependent dipeptidase
MMSKNLTALLLTFLATAPLAAQAITIDPHLDLPKDALSAGWNGRSDATSQFDLDRARSSGLSAAGVALFVVQGPRDAASLALAQKEIVARDAAIHAIYEANPTLAAPALTPADLRRNAARHRFSVVETLLNTWPLGDDLNAFDHYYARGVRIVGFVHAGNNQFADSSRPALQRGDRANENGGLTPLGRRAVARLNDLGVLIDVSQLSDEAFDQVLALSRAPVIATHSDVRALIDNGRNLTDAQLDAIAAKNGVVAINAFSRYLRKPAGADPHGPIAEADRATVADLVDALDYAVKRIGIDHVALSSDFNHGGGVKGWDDVGQLPNVTAELKRRGYTPAQIAKIWSGNVLRVWQAAIDARDRTYRPAV